MNSRRASRDGTRCPALQVEVIEPGRESGDSTGFAVSEEPMRALTGANLPAVRLEPHANRKQRPSRLSTTAPVRTLCVAVKSPAEGCGRWAKSQFSCGLGLRVLLGRN